MAYANYITEADSFLLQHFLVLQSLDEESVILKASATIATSLSELGDQICPAIECQASTETQQDKGERIDRMELITDTKMVWTKKTLKVGSCMIYAGELYIAYADDPRYWKWQKLPEDLEVEVAELIKVSWLEVRGTVPMIRFTSREKYEVLFVLKRTESAKFTTIAKFNLELPNGMKKSRIVDIMTIKPNQWVNVKVGTFRGAPSSGDINFSLEITNKSWKQGLFIGGVLIQHVA